MARLAGAKSASIYLSAGRSTTLSYNRATLIVALPESVAECYCYGVSTAFATAKRLPMPQLGRLRIV
jgi:hypothetical protein